MVELRVCLNPIFEGRNIIIEKVSSGALRIVGRESLVCICEKNTTRFNSTKYKCLLKGCLCWLCLSQFYKFVQYTGMTQRDGMGRVLGGGFRIGNMCTPMEDSCLCMAKPIQYCKVK